VGEDEGIEEGLGGFLLVLGEGGDGLELEPELVIGAALVLLEVEGIDADPEGAGELAETQEGGLGGAGLMAVGLDAGGTRPALVPKLTGAAPRAHSYCREYYRYSERAMKITTKGQVTIPAAIREQLGLLPNTEVEFAIRGDTAVLKKAGRPTARGRRVIVHLQGRATARLTTDQILALTRAG